MSVRVTELFVAAEVDADPEDGTLSARQIMREVWVPEFPRKVNLQFAMHFELDFADRGTEFSWEFQWVSPEGQPVRHDSQETLPADWSVARVPHMWRTLTLRNLEIASSGDYEARVFVDGTLARSAPVRFVQAPS